MNTVINLPNIVPVRERISSEVEFNNHPKLKTLKVGNTGFSLTYSANAKELKGDFMPEGILTYEDGVARYKDSKEWSRVARNTFMYALYNLLLWLKSPNGESFRELDFQFLIHRTNNKFAAFLQKFLQRFDLQHLIEIEELGRDDDFDCKVSIDLRYIMSLEEDSPFYTYLQEVAESFKDHQTLVYKRQ